MSTRALERLEDIFEQAQYIDEYIEGFNKETFLKDSRTLRAVLYSLVVFGEAANHVPNYVQKRFKRVEWAKIVAFRNLLVHEYNHVDMSIVWVTVQEILPPTLAELKAAYTILKQEDEQST